MPWDVVGADARVGVLPLMGVVDAFEGTCMGAGTGEGKWLKLQLVQFGSVAVADKQGGIVITFVSSVMLKLQRRRPTRLVPEFMVMDICARIVPTNAALFLIVAELPATQNTLHAWAAPIKWTALLLSAVMVDDAIMRKAASGLPCPSNVSVPVTETELPE